MSKKFMDALQPPSDNEDDGNDDVSDVSDDDGNELPLAAPAAAKRQKATAAVDIDALQRCGYSSGPSVLYVPPPKPAAPDTDFSWSSGKEHKQDEPDDETFEEREATRAAATVEAEAAAAYARRAAQQAAQLRADRRQEQEQLAKDKRLTFHQKEKRKRDQGQASKGKNYVEEEKRVARNFGVYSGFD